MAVLDSFRMLLNESLARWYDEEPEPVEDVVDLIPSGPNGNLLLAVPCELDVDEATDEEVWITGRPVEVTA